MSDLSTSTCSLEDYCLKPEDKREMDSILQQVGLTNIMESLKTELHSQMMSGGYKFHSTKVFNKSRKSSKTRSSSQFSGGAQSSKRVDFLSKMLAVICLFVLQGYTLHNIIMYIGQPATQITSQTCETPISPTTIQAYEYVYDLLSIEFEAISDTWMPENNRCEIQTDKRSLMLRAAHERWGQVSALTQSGVNKTCLARDVEYYSRVYYFCFFIGSIFLHIFKELGYSRPEEFARYLETRPVFKHLGDILTVGQTLMANPLEALSPAAFNRIKDIGGFNAIGAFFSLAIKWMLSAGIFTQRKLFNVFANGFKYLLAGRSTTDTSLEPGAITQVQDIQETQIEEKFEEILQQSDKALLKQVLCAVPVPEKSSRRERIRLSTSEIDEIIDSSAKKTLSRGGNKKRNHKLKTVKRSKKHKLTIKRASTRHNKHKK
jgi:hypothetical protein